MNECFLTLPKGGLLGDLLPYQLAMANKLPDDYHATVYTFAEMAHDAHLRYEDYLGGHAIPGRGKVPKPYQGGGKAIIRPLAALAWEIGHQDGKMAKALEEGTPEHDMKLDLPNSKKARMGKKGLYLIIPFRHGIPGTRGIKAMPKRIYKQAVAMTMSYHQGVTGQRTSATGFQVPTYGYQWGDKLAAGLAPKMKAHHKGDIYAGMYRFKDEATKGNKSAGYITFRTMSQGSNPRAWIQPAKPGLHPLQTAIDEAWKAGMDGLNGALMDDAMRMLAEALG